MHITLTLSCLAWWWPKSLEKFAISLYLAHPIYFMYIPHMFSISNLCSACPSHVLHMPAMFYIPFLFLCPIYAHYIPSMFYTSHLCSVCPNYVLYVPSMFGISLLCYAWHIYVLQFPPLLFMFHPCSASSAYYVLYVPPNILHIPPMFCMFCQY